MARITNSPLGEEPSISKRFGEALARLRRERGLSQEQLEGVAHRTYVSELERGLKSPTLQTIVKLSQVLGVSPGYLVDLATLVEPDATAQDTTPSGFDLAEVLTRALHAEVEPIDASSPETSPPVSVAPKDSVRAAQDKIAGTGTRIARVLAEAALLAFRERVDATARNQRDALQFYVADKRLLDKLTFTSSATPFALQPVRVRETVLATNRTLELIHDLCLANNVDVFRFLGLRNLSAFVGEILKSELYNQYQSELMLNPHQDGYPDLMALTPQGLNYLEERRRAGQMTVKEFWSPYPYGGLEVKATCGSTPPARKQAKPDIGESRWHSLTGADWKAHHQETNFLLSIYWDFVDGLPTVLAAFFRNDLNQNDWNETVNPKAGGGRTTSVCVMTRPGVLKMGQGWVVLPHGQEMRAAFAKRSVFGVSQRDVEAVCSDFA